jgi:hypothetical protein|tara:strand:+ start:509 stop:676 length:168 start_codon:yes stop_codon:yes gene_type:complete
MATRKMTDKGPGKIGETKTQEKKLEPTTGNSANFPDLNKDGEITFADVLLGRGVK